MRVLLVFARVPVPGRVKTRLVPVLGPHGAARLYRAFLEDVARWSGRTGADRVVWWVDGDPGALPVPWAEAHRQPPGDLGTRLWAAVGRAFRAGAGPVAVLGTDCPHLAPGAVEDLFRRVEGGLDAAVLPARDGGYMGLCLAEPLPELFHGIPWSTDRVLAATLDRLREAGRRAWLSEPVFDVDTPRDLEDLARLLAAEPARAPSTARALRDLGWIPARRGSAG